MRMHVSPFPFVQFLCSRAKDSLPRVIRLCELGLLSPGVHRVSDARAVGMGILLNEAFGPTITRLTLPGDTALSSLKPCARHPSPSRFRDLLQAR